MKKIVILFIIAFISLSLSNVSAQSFKFGHINSGELLKTLPDIDSVQKKMQAYAKDLELIIEEMQVEYNKKYDAYQKSEATLSEAVKAARQKELADMGRRVQDRMSSANSEYDAESQKQMAPVIEKVRAAISKVGKDNGFTYIFDISAGSIPYINEAQSVDIMEMVKKELKVKK